MSAFATIVIRAEKGDRIRVSASGFAESEAQIQLVTKADFDAFQKSYNNDDDPVVLTATAMITLTSKSQESLLDIPALDDWHIIYQPWRAKVKASKLSE